MSVGMVAPRMDEVWQDRNGRQRHVTFVSDGTDGTYDHVSYTRPPPAQEGHAVVSLDQWRAWVERERAYRVQRTWRAL